MVLIGLRVAQLDVLGAQRGGGAGVDDVEVGAGGGVDGGVAGACGQEEAQVGQGGEDGAWEWSAFAHGADDCEGVEPGYQGGVVGGEAGVEGVGEGGECYLVGGCEGGEVGGGEVVVVVEDGEGGRLRWRGHGG